MTPTQVRGAINDATALIEELHTLRQQPPQPFTPESRDQQTRLRKAHPPPTPHRRRRKRPAPRKAGPAARGGLAAQIAVKFGRRKMGTRILGEGAEKVYAAAQQWVEQQALRRDGSLFTLEKSIRSSSGIVEFYRRFLNNPDESKATGGYCLGTYAGPRPLAAVISALPASFLSLLLSECLYNASTCAKVMPSGESTIINAPVFFSSSSVTSRTAADSFSLFSVYSW